MTQVTVLIAVYNAERTLRKTLDSLLAQSMGQWQAVCVDDASTDSSLSILQEYAARDERFRISVLHENRGQSHARNQGLLMAEGIYTCFLDADDWLAPDALAHVVRTFEENENTDCVLFDCRMVDDESGNETAYPMAPFDVKTGKEAFLDSLTWKIHGVYAIRTALHICYPYDETARSYSDDNTTRVHYYTSRQVRSCRGTYYYRQHSGSVTHTVSPSRLNRLLADESMKRTLVQMGCGEDVLQMFEHQRWLTLIDTYMFYYAHRRRFSRVVRRDFLATMQRYWGDIHSEEDKFGYRHCDSWQSFRRQEEVYFFLRKIKKMIRFFDRSLL